MALKKSSSRTIAVVTSTRADWGLLAPVAEALAADERVTLKIIATNMHLDPARGMTVNEIIADGFNVDYRVDMIPDTDSPKDTVRAMSRCMDGMARVFDDCHPDLLLLLGDRYEMLAVASAATLFRIPIAHISGGEITEGAIDDNIRHALSKLSSLHFATTESHRHRLIAMGEIPDNVVNAGALGVYNILHLKLLSKNELETGLGFEITKKSLLVTFHPATNDPVAPEQRFGALLDALDNFQDAQIIFTYPNNDPGSEIIIRMIEDYVLRNAGRAVAVPSMGRLRYLSSLRCVSAVVGNSSSGVVEVPSSHIPTVNIGIRQKGRTASRSVINCGDTVASISEAIAFALSPQGRKRAEESPNPYENPSTVSLIATKLINADIAGLLPKKFFDICNSDH